MERIEESVAGAQYVDLVLFRAKETARLAMTFLTDTHGLDRALAGAVRNPGWPCGLAILGSTLSSLVNYSPVFAERREQAHRLEFWTLFSLMTDHPAPDGTPIETVLRTVRVFQVVDHDFVQKRELPYGNIAARILRAWFPKDQHHFYMPNSDTYQPFLVTVLGDLFAITCAECFAFWKDIGEKYEILRSEPPDGMTI